MSGIAGIIERRRRASDADVYAMLRSMGPRSACAQSVKRSGSAILGVGHLSGARRSAAASYKHLSIVGDLRLDDPGALAARLGLADQAPAALVLHAYRKWGEECPAFLEGDFAFALWDDERKSLFHARDGFGVKPFHYFEDDHIFAFASEPKAILALAQTPRRVSEIRLAEFLEGAVPPADKGFYADIHRLAPGDFGWADSQRSRRSSYWRLSPPEAAGAPSPGDAERFFGLFENAVQRRMPEEGPLACLLSGGLDSSSISCVAQGSLSAGHSLHTVSVVFDRNPALSERTFIEGVLAQGGYQPSFVDGDRYDPFTGFDALLEQQDGLFLAPNLSMMIPALKTVPSGGVLLDGHGGDEVVSKGGGHLYDLARGGRWRTLWRELAGVADLYGETPVAMFANYFQAFGPGRYKIRALKRALGQADVRQENLLSEDLRRRTDIAERLKARAPRRPQSGADADMALLDVDHQSYGLEVLDRAAAGAGIETRFPFWDRKLIEFSLSLSPRTKLDGGWTRLILRQALQGRLPPSVQWRRDKRDFTPLLVRGLLDRNATNALQQGRRLGLERFVDLDVVDQARVRLKNPQGRSGRDAQRVWRATALSCWLTHADAKGVQIVESA